MSHILCPEHTEVHSYVQGKPGQGWRCCHEAVVAWLSEEVLETSMTLPATSEYHLQSRAGAAGNTETESSPAPPPPLWPLQTLRREQGSFLGTHWKALLPGHSWRVLFPRGPSRRHSSLDTPLKALPWASHGRHAPRASHGRHASLLGVPALKGPLSKVLLPLPLLWMRSLREVSPNVDPWVLIRLWPLRVQISGFQHRPGKANKHMRCALLRGAGRPRERAFSWGLWSCWASGTEDIKSSWESSAGLTQLPLSLSPALWLSPCPPSART